MLSPRMLGLLMLMILLHVSESTCPIGSSPLTLDPPKIIGKYGELMIVNCTSNCDDHNGMHWTDGNKMSTEEDQFNFIPWTVSLSDWDVRAQCKIREGGNEYGKDLVIIVYKNPDRVSLYPTNGEITVLQNTLKCDVTNVAPVRNLIVRWYKGDVLLAEESDNSKTRTPANRTFFLDVSREDDGAKIKCVAQLDFGKNELRPPPISSDILSISVLYAPELKNHSDIIKVEEGDNITLHCNMDGNPTPFYIWTQDDVEILKNSSSVYITLLKSSATYSCTAINKLGNQTTHIYVHVMKSTTPKARGALIPTTPTPYLRGCPLTLRPSDIVVRFEDKVSVECRTSARDALELSWNVSHERNVHEQFSVNWTVDKLQAWTIKPSCYTIFRDDYRCSVSPAITIYKTPDTVSLSLPNEGPMEEGKEYTLDCIITNVAPVQNLTVKWYRGNESVHNHTFHSTTVTPENVSHSLILTPDKDYDGAHFRCEAQLLFESVQPAAVSSTSYISTVHYKPRILACPDSYSGAEHEFSLSKMPCEADGNPKPVIFWYNRGELINGSKPLTRSHSGEYTAEAVNDLGNSSTSVDITIEYRPSFNCKKYYDVPEHGQLRMCEAEGLPSPVTTWYKDGKEMTPPERWSKHDSGEYFLRAVNKHGTANHTVQIDVLYPPVLTMKNYSKEVRPGENFTLDCSAEGNPPPNISWKYASAGNVGETTGGRKNSISVTGATSTNAGVYDCIATNKVGSVSKSVTLIMKGRLSAVTIAVISTLGVALLVVLVLLIANVSKKKYGQYSFIRNNDNADIPLRTARS